MAEESFEEKTEPASDRRRGEARSKGSVAKSTEVHSVIVLLVALLMLRIFGPWMYRELVGFFSATLERIRTPQMEYGTVAVVIRDMVFFTAKVTAPVLGGVLVAGVVANLIQVGFLFTLQPLIPNFQKIDPFSGTKRLFSTQSIVELMKNLVKLAIVGLVAFLTIKGEFDKFMILCDTSVGFIWVFMLKEAFDIVLRIILILIVIAALDYWFQRFQFEKKLRMTKQEVKEEHKQMDGDPQIKGRIRSLQREMARRRMMREVPKATVVVTNPTHIAIALRYEPDLHKAPLVLAKGKRLIAQKIKEIAIAAGVPIVEDKPLARAMYDKVEIGNEIPVEFFTAVAEILAYVYRLKNRMAA